MRVPQLDPFPISLCDTGDPRVSRICAVVRSDGGWRSFSDFAVGSGASAVEWGEIQLCRHASRCAQFGARATLSPASEIEEHDVLASPESCAF